MPEVIRMIDLFSSTYDHTYHVDSETEDGYHKGTEADAAYVAAAGTEKGLYNGPVLQVTRRIWGGEAGSSGLLHVSVTFDALEPMDMSALGLWESLPAGWVFEGGDTGASLMIAPVPGAEDLLELAWFPVPDLPYTYNYDVSFGVYPEAGNADTLPEGLALYRTVLGRDEYQAPVEGIVLSDEGDLDGDGIADVLDGLDDVDGDGIPGFLDADSDNDGLSDETEQSLGTAHDLPDTDGDGLGDFYEVAYDGDASSLDAYDAETNPAGVDLNPLKPDTDGDGVDDGEEDRRGTNGTGVDPGGSAGVPGPSGAVLVLLAVLMIAVGLRAIRRIESRKKS